MGCENSFLQHLDEWFSILKQKKLGEEQIQVGYESCGFFFKIFKLF